MPGRRTPQRREPRVSFAEDTSGLPVDIHSSSSEAEAEFSSPESDRQAPRKVAKKVAKVAKSANTGPCEVWHCFKSSESEMTVLGGRSGIVLGQLTLMPAKHAEDQPIKKGKKKVVREPEELLKPFRTRNLQGKDVKVRLFDLGDQQFKISFVDDEEVGVLETITEGVLDLDPLLFSSLLGLLDHNVLSLQVDPPSPPSEEVSEVCVRVVLSGRAIVEHVTIFDLERLLDRKKYWKHLQDLMAWLQPHMVDCPYGQHVSKERRKEESEEACRVWIWTGCTGASSMMS